MKIILLSGWSQSGKSTVAEILAKEYDAYTFAFADVLKRIVSEEYSFPYEWTLTQIGKQVKLPCGKTVRDLLIQRGQEIRAEKKDPGYFAKLVAEKIQKLPSSATVILSDWRLEIEYVTLKDMLHLPNYQIYTVHIVRDGQLESPVKDPLTENSLLDLGFKFDLVLFNPGSSISLLKQIACEMVKKMLV